jgi:hypothetical protein
MNNDITINPEEILKMPDNSIVDRETIRQIALYGIKTNDSSLDCKIKREFQFAGLYPHVMMPFNINPEALILHGWTKGVHPITGEHYVRKDKQFSGGLHGTIKTEFLMKNNEEQSIKDIVKELLKQTPLETRLKVSIEMTFIQILVELGFIESRPWDSENEEDNRILKIILDTSEKESKYLAKQVKKWQADGMPE